jgi:hypothetical protein
LYHIISGACPYRESNTASTILKASHAEYTPLLELAPDTEPALIRVVERAMSLKRSDRQADAKKFAEELKAWLADSTTKREGRSMTDTFASGLSALLLAFMLLGFGLVLAMTPLTSIGPTALVVLIFGSLGCVLSLLEWQTKGRHHLSHLCLALAAVTFLVGLANTALGELQVHTVGMKLDSSLDKEEAMRGLAAGRKIVLQSIPIVLIMTAMQLSLWAVVKRMIDRASLKEARS